MTSIKTIFVAAGLFAGLFASAESTDMKPLQGVSFHVGTKHAVAYFLSESGACKLVVTSADDANFAPVRSEKVIGDGASAKYQLAEGKSINFTCLNHGQAMNATTLETTAAN